IRKMPSLTEMIVPSSETYTPQTIPSICCLRMLVISSALISAMPHSPLRPSVRPDQPPAQGFELMPEGPVVAPGPDSGARPAQKGRINLMPDIHRAPGHGLERLTQALQLRRRQRHRRGGLRLHDPQALVLDFLEGPPDGGERPQAPIADQDRQEVARRRAQPGLARQGVDRGLLVLLRDRGVREEAPELGIGAQDADDERKLRGRRLKPRRLFFDGLAGLAKLHLEVVREGPRVPPRHGDWLHSCAPDRDGPAAGTGRTPGGIKKPRDRLMPVEPPGERFVNDAK